MQANDLRARLRSSSLRSAAKPALYLLSFTIAGASCAAELEDPDRYEVAKGVTPGTGGSVPAATGGTPGSGGTIGATGGTGTGGTTATGGATQGGTGTGGAPASMVTLDPCVKALFAAKCTSCHSTAFKDAFAGLDLSGDAVIARLQDVPATHRGVSNPATCVSGAMLINSANPAESVLLKRVKGTPDCGTAMPSPPGLTGSDLSCIETWIMKF